MTDKPEELSSEQLDYLREVLNIGAGNAATALNQMLYSRVAVKMPQVLALPFPKVPAVLRDPTLPSMCAKMELLGDVKGILFFIVGEEDGAILIQVAKQAMGGVG